MTAGPSLLVVDDGPIRWLRLNRPEALNALNGEVIAALDTEFGRLEGNPDMRVVVITGMGDRAFSAGADLDELRGLSAGEAAAVLGRGQQVFRRIEESAVPVIAAVNGFALGGGFELALACSFIVASDNAGLGLPETNLGLIPGYGGTQRLSRLIGRQLALYVILTGKPVAAARAFELGVLAEPPVRLAELGSRATDLATIVAAKGPGAVRLVLEATGGDSRADLGLRYETALAALATSSAEAAEGVAAFLEKRPAKFACRS